MRREFTVEDAMLMQLKEQQTIDQRNRLLNEPTFRISVNRARLRTLLGVGSKVFKRDFGEIRLDPNPDQKGRFFVTGEQFTSLEAMKIQITQARRHRRRAA